jgi:endonuclease/exonuclease/phosphatase family metal-dependent hydrolase
MASRWLSLAGIAGICLATLACRHGVPARPAAHDRAHARLRVLTLNLMQMSPVARRDVRFGKIAEFIRTRRDEGRPVDVLLLQEGCAGIWVGTRDSLVELRQHVALAAAPYNLHSRSCFGVPAFLTFEVGILCLAPPLYTAAAALPCPTGDWLDDCPLPGARRAVMVGIDHPIGRVNLFTVHLASGGKTADREAQADALIRFARDTAASHPAALTVVAGDMNASPDTRIYQRLAEAFRDSYAAVNPGREGPTFNLPGNPHCEGYGGSPLRIDYVFFEGEGVEVEGSEVVFAETGWFVSDHAGVLTTFRRSGP